MKKLHLDIETESPVDLKLSGIHVYAEKATIALFGFAFDDDPVSVVDLAHGETLPDKVVVALKNDSILKIAHNAAFERTLIKACLKIDCPPEAWRCTMVLCLYNGLPKSLDAACRVLGLPGKLKTLDVTSDKAYNANDVVIERRLWAQLDPMPEDEWRLWAMDQHINDAGVLIDELFVYKAVRLLTENRAKLMAEAKKLTNLANPNSPAQLGKWLGLDNVKKETITEELKTAEGDRKRVLEIRQVLALSSVSKYQTFLHYRGSDGRVRDSLQFIGGHTGRWAGRGIQPQNLPRRVCSDETFGKTLDNAEDIELFFGSLPAFMSSMLRSVIIAPPGGYLRIDDYSSIEARVCAWLAKEEWILKVFRDKGPYYEITATKLYNLTLDKVDKPMRQKGKVAALSLQYQGGVAALKKQGASDYMTEEEMEELKHLWRRQCPHIVRYWYALDEAAQAAVRTGTTIKVGCIAFRYQNNNLYIDLPSKRYLIYRNARLGISAHTGGPTVGYDAPKGKNMVYIQLYGGLLTENIVQALSRDIMCEQLKHCYEHCILTIHDEIVLENHTLATLYMPGWASGLPMEIKGYNSPHYTKD